MALIDRYLEEITTRGGSDLHISAGTPVRFRLHGRMSNLETEDLLPEESERMILEIIPPASAEAFASTNDLDFAYTHSEIGRFRVNAFRDRSGVGAVLRYIPTVIPTMQELNLPPVIEQFAHLPRGIVLVTGPTGSGKSTTLASIIDKINTDRDDHIITIEDPIEFIHENKRSLVNQREVGSHTGSFASALRAALRQDPDVILVGEIRDLETTAMALEAAETGHLVLGTLHTSSAASTVHRIVDQFPAEAQSQILTQLAGSLAGVVSQCLLRRKDGGGRVAAHEILVATPAVSALIRDGKTHQVVSAIQTGGRLGMTLLNDSLLKLVSRGLVDPHEAYLKSPDKEGLLRAYGTAGIQYAPKDVGLGGPPAAPASAGSAAVPKRGASAPMGRTGSLAMGGRG